jgi:hypothetical protein
MWDSNTWTKLELRWHEHESWWNLSYADYFSNISNIVIQDNLIMDNESHQTFSNDISCKKRNIKYLNWKMNKISNMFYKDNVNPILNT